MIGEALREPPNRNKASALTTESRSLPGCAPAHKPVEGEANDGG